MAETWNLQVGGGNCPKCPLSGVSRITMCEDADCPVHQGDADHSAARTLTDAVEALRKIRMSRPAGNAAAYRKRVAEAFFAAHPEHEHKT